VAESVLSISSDGKEVGQIPKNGKGLYKVVHEDAESSFVATEKLTMYGIPLPNGAYFAWNHQETC